jgi:NTP pyrophosphatase (non-canonical NTP hydrolase)
MTFEITREELPELSDLIVQDVSGGHVTLLKLKEVIFRDIYRVHYAISLIDYSWILLDYSGKPVPIEPTKTEIEGMEILGNVKIVKSKGGIIELSNYSEELEAYYGKLPKPTEEDRLELGKLARLRPIERFRKLQGLVEEWAAVRGILTKATLVGQAKKTIEEAQELLEAAYHLDSGIPEYMNSKGKLVKAEEEFVDALGDVFVTIIIGSKLRDLDLLNCLESAYNVISKRKGKMENGQFKKDE